MINLAVFVFRLLYWWFFLPCWQNGSCFYGFFSPHHSNWPRSWKHSHIHKLWRLVAFAWKYTALVFSPVPLYYCQSSSDILADWGNIPNHLSQQSLYLLYRDSLIIPVCWKCPLFTLSLIASFINNLQHDDVITWKTFPHIIAFPA